MGKPKVKRQSAPQGDRKRKNEDEIDFDETEIEELQRLVQEARTSRPSDKKQKKRKQKDAQDEEEEEENGIDDNDEQEIDEDDLSDEERVLRELRAERERKDLDDEEEEEDEEDDEEEHQGSGKPQQNSKPFANEAPALRESASELRLDNFAESLVIIDETEYTDKLNPEDDKLREARFQEMATRAVNYGRAKLDELKVPHRRPTDFMAEMIKSDDHMAKVKRRLIVEQQKMRVVESRKAAERNKKRSKEIKKQRDQEKTKRKRDASEMAASYREKDGVDDDSRKKQKTHGGKPSGGKPSGGNKKGAKPRLGKQKRKSIRGARGKH